MLDRPVFRAMRRAGRWPLLLSIERRELANLIPPDGTLAARLKLTPPASGDRVLHLVPAPLDLCRIGPDGIATPAVGPDVLAAHRLAEERREQQLAESLRYLNELHRQRAPDPDPGALERYLARTRGQPAPEPVGPSAKPAAEHRAQVTPRVRKAIETSGDVTTLGALLTELGMHDQSEVREQLNTLRADGVIAFREPLGLFAAIHKRTRGRPEPR